MSTPDPADLFSGGEIHVFYASPPLLPPPGDQLRLLTADELERYHRYIPDHARLEFLAGRVLLRTVLARYLECAPESIEFEKEQHGKLRLANLNPRKIQFNLTHTRGLAACAISPGHSIGIDAELIDPARVTLGVAERYFSRGEVAYLSGFREPDRIEPFFRIWTLKEAYIKAKGLGLSLPLKDFCFEFNSAGEFRAIRFEDCLNENPSDWQFATLRLGVRHFLSLAMMKKSNPDLDIRLIGNPD